MPSLSGSQSREEGKRALSRIVGAPVKLASTRVGVPPVQLDGSAPKTVPTPTKGRGRLRRREAGWGAGMESNPAPAGSQYR